MEKRVRLTLLEEFLVLLLVLDDPGLKWMFSDVDLLQRFLTVPSATGNMNLSPFIGVNTSFALSLLASIPDASICSNSQMSVICKSPFQIPPAFYAYLRNFPGETFGPNWCTLDRSFAEIGWYSTIAPNGVTGPSNGIPKRLSYGVFPSQKIFRK